MSLNPTPKARVENLVVQELQDEVLIYDLVTNQAHCLNASAAFVWKNCDGHTSHDQIVSAFAANWSCDSPRDLVEHAIEQLHESHLIQSPQITSRSSSRRQLLKNLGLASAAALPLVQSLVAPKALYASVNCACVSNADCIVQTSCPAMTCGPSGQCV